MGLFSNPLGHAGFPPGATAPATTVNSTVRAATLAESTAGTRSDVYISPALQSAFDAAIFAVPPALGSTTPNAVSSTTLGATGLASLATMNTTGDTNLATAVTATAVSIAGAANTGALVVNIATGASAADSTVNILNGANSAGTPRFNVATGSATGAILNFGTGPNTTSISVGTGAAANQVRIASSTSSLGFYGKLPTAVQVLPTVTNSSTGVGVAGTISALPDLTVFANSASQIDGNFNQIAIYMNQITTALTNLGLTKTS